MNSQHDKPKRWRPRFSVRALVIVVTLVCCYAACWGPTTRQGVKDVGQVIDGSEGLITAYVLVDGFDGRLHATIPLVVRLDRFRGVREYYFWFFGYVAKLPWEQEITVVRVPVDFDFEIDDNVTTLFPEF